MEIKSLEHQYFIYPMFAISSVNPDLSNDWSAWMSDEQKFLAYSDIVWIAINDNAFFEKEYTIHIVSDSVKLGNHLSHEEYNSFIKSSLPIWSGQILLINNILLIGDGTTDGGDEVKVNKDNQDIEVYADFYSKKPFILIKIL